MLAIIVTCSNEFWAKSLAEITEISKKTNNANNKFNIQQNSNPQILIDSGPNSYANALKDHKQSQQVPEKNPSFLRKFLEEFKAMFQQLG